jgi:hypothetical protein
MMKPLQRRSFIEDKSDDRIQYNQSLASVIEIPKDKQSSNFEASIPKLRMDRPSKIKITNNNTLYPNKSTIFLLLNKQ